MSPKRKSTNTERRLNTHVTTVNPDTGRSETFGPDDELPSWFEDEVTNPDVWSEVSSDDDVEESSPAEPEVPAEPSE